MSRGQQSAPHVATDRRAAGLIPAATLKLNEIAQIILRVEIALSLAVLLSAGTAVAVERAAEIVSRR